MKKQKGFTLIELVVVIAVLGILSAFVGSLSSAIGIVKAKFIANGSDGAGGAITMNTVEFLMLPEFIQL